MKRHFSIYFPVIWFLVLSCTGMAFWFQETGQLSGQGEDAWTCGWGDYNNDGKQDILVSRGLGVPHLYKNTPGGFVDVAAAMGISYSGGLKSCCWGDFNNDGNLDLFLTGPLVGERNMLYRNRGAINEYQFESVYNDVVGEPGDARCALWGDFNNDALLDLYVINNSDQEFEPPCKMYRNTGNGFAVQGCIPSELNSAFSGVAGDFDNDGDLDIFVSNCRTGNKLYRNLLKESGIAWNFEDVASEFGVQLPNECCESASFCDYDFDNDLDLLIMAGAINFLYRNDGQDFVLRNEEAIWQYGGLSGSWADFDLDGDFDLAVGGAINTPDPNIFNRIWQNAHREDNLYFVDVTDDAGISDQLVGWSVEWADYDFDGKSDFFIGHDNGDEGINKLYRNTYDGPGRLNHYFFVKLIGTGSNRDGIGAHIVLEYQANGNPTQQMAEVSGGGTGGTSQGSLPIEFGVGEALYVDAVKVYWPAGDTSILEHVPTDRRITVVEPGTISPGPYALTGFVWDHEIHGDYYISGNLTFSGVDLTINPGTKIYFHKAWRTNYPAQFVISGNAQLTVNGTPAEPVLFSSQYPIPLAGDWTGLVKSGQQGGMTLQNCQIEYALNGLFSAVGTSPDYLDINSCTFRQMGMAGIDLDRPSNLTAMEIRQSRFDTCGSYGIRIRNDGFEEYPAISIEEDTVRQCNYGIWYSGNSNSPGTRISRFNKNIMTRPSHALGYYGLYISKKNTAGYSPVVEIDSDSISWFQQGGISLNSVDAASTLRANKVKHNAVYGLNLSNSSPQIIGSQSDYNVFNWSSTGIHCDKNSNPRIRWTKIKENNSYGVLVDSRDPNADCPDLGIAGDNGMNSFLSPSSFPYYDIKNNNAAAPIVRAVGNWWGEIPVNQNEFFGPVDRAAPLTSDPLGGSEKREAASFDMKQEVILGQNYPNPFNLETRITFTLAEGSQVTLNIYNICGQFVKTVWSGFKPSGEHCLLWDGRNSLGEEVGSGIYFYLLSSGQEKMTRRMTLLR